MNLDAPAREEAIAAVEAEIKRPLPAAYRAFLARANGGEGRLGITFVYFSKIEDIPQILRVSEVTSLAPELFFFGGDGLGEVFACDGRMGDE